MSAPSVFGWLDGDDAQRARMLEIVRLFQEKGSVDELGIGAIRDAFSDALFPGTSVLHTRARYLLFIPWLLQHSTRRAVAADAARAELRRSEVRLIHALLAGEESAGVIGNQAKDRLQRFPSAVYWPALRRLGLVRWDVSIDRWLRAAVSRRRREVEVTSQDDAALPRDLGLHRALPAAPKDLLDVATFDLTGDEAEFLRSRFATLPSSSVFSWLATHADTAVSGQIWQHPQLGEMPAEQRARIEHARRLHHLWHGAPLVYNLLLARLCDDTDQVDHYCAELDRWDEEIEVSQALRGWDRTDFWMLVHRLNPRVRPATRHFLNGWIDLVQRGEHRGSDAEIMIRRQEIRLKGARARLENSAARDTWSGGAGLVRLEFRWPVAQSFLTDVLDGLERDAA